MSTDGRYDEPGISQRQQFGGTPVERHSLCEGQMQERRTQRFVAMALKIQRCRYAQNKAKSRAELAEAL